MDYSSSQLATDLVAALTPHEKALPDALKKDNRVFCNIVLPDGLTLQTILLSKFEPPEMSAFNAAIIDLVKNGKEKTAFQINDAIGGLLCKHFPDKYKQSTVVSYADTSVCMYEILRLYKPAWLRELMLRLVASNYIYANEKIEILRDLICKAFSGNDERDGL